MIKRTLVELSFLCETEKKAKTLNEVLKPENTLLDERTQIVSTLEKNTLKIKIHSLTEVKSIRFILDDIFFTIEAIEKIYGIIVNDFNVKNQTN